MRRSLQSIKTNARRRSGISFFGVAILAAAPWITSACQADKPNVMFLLSDDHSYPGLSCYGDPNVNTPHIDSLAARGVRFHRFFTTAPQCVLSRASLMTGRSPVAARIIRFSSPLAADEVTFPELLREHAGYYTGICGRSYHLDGSRSLAPAVASIFQRHSMRTFQRRVDYLRKGSDAQVVEQVREFLDTRPKDKPFFMWANYSDPHHAWNAPESFCPDPSSLELPAHWPDLTGVREQVANYCAEVNRVDSRVGEVLALLKERDLVGSTIIIFAGDNGAALPHGKGSLYDPGSNVPFVVAWPAMPAPGTDSFALVSGEDLAPTLLQAAGVKVPETMSGVSFLPILQDPTRTTRRHLFIARGPHGSAPVRLETTSAPYDMGRAVRSDRYKLIYNCTPWTPYGPVDSANGQAWKQMQAAHAAGELTDDLQRAYFTTPRPVYELYDLETDPSELKNLTGRAEYAEMERKLRETLAEKMILEFDHLPLPDLMQPRK